MMQKKQRIKVESRRKKNRRKEGKTKIKETIGKERKDIRKDWKRWQILKIKRRKRRKIWEREEKLSNKEVMRG